jgi:hypothetical protein
MKKSLLAIALAVVMTPFVFATQATGTNAAKPAATSAAKVNKAKTRKVKHARKAKHAPAGATAATQK